MPRYIDADALDEIVQDMNENHGTGITRNEYKRISGILWEFPTADVVKRKKGKWIDGRCSECGEHAPFWSMASTYHTTPYCYNCGADMRKEIEDATH